MASPTPQQFAELFVTHQRRVYGFILTVVPHTADADEIFQDTSLILWKKIDSFELGSDFVAWANAIAFNLVRNYRAAKSRDRHLFSEDLMATIADRRIERAEELDDRLAALSTCLDKLAAGDRELVRLCYGGTESITQVAEQRNQSRNAVYQRLHRVRRKLVECIDHETQAEAGDAS